MTLNGMTLSNRIDSERPKRSGLQRLEEMNMKKIFVCMMAAAVAVSYTHLDVYKRQSRRSTVDALFVSSREAAEFIAGQYHLIGFTARCFQTKQFFNIFQNSVKAGLVFLISGDIVEMCIRDRSGERC